MRGEHILRLTADEAIVLHQVLGRAEDLAVSGDDFERLGTPDGQHRKVFLDLQVKAQEICTAAMRCR